MANKIFSRLFKRMTPEKADVCQGNNKAFFNKDTWKWTFFYDRKSTRFNKSMFWNELERLDHGNVVALKAFKDEHPEDFRDLFFARFNKQYIEI